MPSGESILFAERFIAPLLRNPRIINIHKIFTGRGQLFHSMQLMDQNLRVALHNDTLKFSQKLQICSDILSGVEYLHSRGICHRDLKLENILLDKNQRAYISDFSFASICTPITSGICGSTGYTAPEIFTSTSYDGLKADIYSLGMIFHVILTHHLPNDGCHKCEHQSLPPGFLELINACIRHDPNQRPSAILLRANGIFSNMNHPVLPPNDRNHKYGLEHFFRASMILGIPIEEIRHTLLKSPQYYTHHDKMIKILLNLLEESRSQNSIYPSGIMATRSLPITLSRVSSVGITSGPLEPDMAINKYSELLRLLQKYYFCVCELDECHTSAIFNKADSDETINIILLFGNSAIEIYVVFGTNPVQEVSIIADELLILFPKPSEVYSNDLIIQDLDVLNPPLCS